MEITKIEKIKSITFLITALNVLLSIFIYKFKELTPLHMIYLLILNTSLYTYHAKVIEIFKDIEDFIRIEILNIISIDKDTTLDVTLFSLTAEAYRMDKKELIKVKNIIDILENISFKKLKIRTLNLGFMVIVSTIISKLILGNINASVIGLVIVGIPISTFILLLFSIIGSLLDILRRMKMQDNKLILND